MTDLPNVLYLVCRNGRDSDLLDTIRTHYPDAEITPRGKGIIIVVDGLCIDIGWEDHITVSDELGNILYRYSVSQERTTITMGLFRWHTNLFRDMAKAVGTDLDTVEGFA